MASNIFVRHLQFIVHTDKALNPHTMADTFSQIYIQVVFAVKGRYSFINQRWEDELYKYITGIIRNNNQKMLAINGMPDHIHFLIDMKPDCCLSDLIRETKKSTNKFINENNFNPSKFFWQKGFGSFSYSHSHLDRVIKYILNQKKHHQTKTFKEEYKEMLRKFNVDYNPEYLFDFES